MTTVEHSPSARGTFKRDALVDIERTMQSTWASEHLFEPETPAARSSSEEKFMATFPYPYMNGKLHLGHAFTLSKVDIAVAYERQKGKRVLFPFAFHCTGMPIPVAAAGIAKEIAQYGNPPQFPAEEDAADGREKKSKVAAKEGRAKYKWELLEAMGIPSAEIAAFADPTHWCRYFPPQAEHDLRAIGAQIDWRRSFITTDLNPFYDAFVRWQFNRLRQGDFVRFGKRYTIYAPADKQACMDHDRQSGEGVEPEEFTGIKMLLRRDLMRRDLVGAGLVSVVDSLPAGSQVFLLAATLRPETVYGQTNCWVGPDVEYGCYRVGEDEFFVCTPRAARNLAHQGFSRAEGVVERAGPLFPGRDLINAPLSAPLSANAVVYVLPMMTVSAVKGTGIVTSVPSNSPDDYAALRDLKEKPPLRQKYGVPEAHVLPFVPLPIIDTPGLGQLAAERAVTELGIRSQNDRDLLEQAKERCYKEDFYQGTMLVGDHAGRPVHEAKAAIRETLLSSGQAVVFYAPKSVVMSRSGDECVVALIDQWYLAYGEPAWRARAELCLSRMNCFSAEVANAFSQSLDWMHQWACSRSFGLGTRLPWDEKFLIESLSDSTVYMAYYCVARFLQPGSLDGSKGNPHHIRPDDMTDAAWDYVFSLSDRCPDGAHAGVFAEMRAEFLYWYPLDLRVSGKDLISNHLTMFIYNHVAIFPEHLWPRAVRANGHLLLNSAKMSKSTGNFMTLADAVGQFGADATRIALADSGDTTEDANFLVDIANGAILRLHALKELAEQVTGGGGEFREGGCCFADRVFAAELSRTVLAVQSMYDAAMYREVVKHALYELQNARDRYRDMTVVHCDRGSSWFGMSRALMMRYLEVQARVLAPIAPHICDYLWRHCLKRGGSVLSCGPLVGLLAADGLTPDELDALSSAAHVAGCASDFRALLAACKKRPSAAVVYVAADFPAWQKAIHALAGEDFADDKAYVLAVTKQVAPLCTNKVAKKNCIPYAMEYRKGTRGSIASGGAAQFDEAALLEECRGFLSATLKVPITAVERVADVDSWAVEGVLPPMPMRPSVHYSADGAVDGVTDGMRKL